MTTKCSKCNAPFAYNSGFTEECINPVCKNYSEKQVEITGLVKVDKDVYATQDGSLVDKDGNPFHHFIEVGKSWFLGKAVKLDKKILLKKENSDVAVSGSSKQTAVQLGKLKTPKEFLDEMAAKKESEQ